MTKITGNVSPIELQSVTATSAAGPNVVSPLPAHPGNGTAHAAPEFLDFASRPPLPDSGHSFGTESMLDCYKVRKLMRELSSGNPVSNTGSYGDGGPKQPGSPSQNSKPGSDGPGSNPLPSTPLSTSGDLFQSDGKPDDGDHGGPPDAFPKAIELPVEQPMFHHDRNDS